MKTIHICMIAGLVLASSTSADVIYGTSEDHGGSLWAIDLDTNQATQRAGQLGFSPANLATNTDRGILYVGQRWQLEGGIRRGSLRIHAYDLSTGENSLLTDLSGHPVVAHLEDPSSLFEPNSANAAFFQEGGAYHQGAFYVFLNTIDPNLDCHGRPFGPGTTLYKLELTPDGKGVATDSSGLAKLSALEIGPMPDSNFHSVGDLGDFVIFPDGTVFGSTWNRDPSRPPPCQVGGFWIFHLSDPEHSFQLLQDTQAMGENAPTYGLALGEDQETLYGDEFFTPGRMDVLATGGAAGVLARSTFPEAAGNQVQNGPARFGDLSCALPRERPLIPIERIEGLEEVGEQVRVRISWFGDPGSHYEIQTSRELKYWGVPGYPGKSILATGPGNEIRMSKELVFPAAWDRGFVRVRRSSQ